ncbi:CLIP domain-containing serine protease HP8-like [Macrosteles quadrilineatus]|uniref:CLIP domain-containing serine protease HP8-like n=1 Tax=Macrosteles quadrilineatus TaxID=74068 RepID=UPI0023E32141|nr:CLIP domain-containing serine protease HP8-like [Macrosteles quadrilineatus]
MVLVCNLFFIIFSILGSVFCSFSCNDRGGCALLPPTGRCGKVRPAPRVTGGHDAKLGQFPWAALIYASNGNLPKTFAARLISGFNFRRKRKNVFLKLVDRRNKFPICGGSIVSDRFVVTAAHCCKQGPEMRIVSVRVGEHNLDSKEDCQAGACSPPPQDIEVERYVIHEEFNADLLKHDICLIRLRKPISYNDFVVPICLPITEDLQSKNFTGTYLEVAGWGIMEFDLWTGIRATVLQTTSLPVVSLDECQRVMGSQVTASPNICAGGEGNKDSCSGDSGGPLMGRFFDVTGSAQSYYLIGVVSHGDTYCSGDMPGVYVHVPAYLEWIVNKMDLLSKGR